MFINLLSGDNSDTSIRAFVIVKGDYSVTL